LNIINFSTMTHETLGDTSSETESGTITYGQTISGGRELFGFSQTELAKRAEISQGYLSQLEKDEIENPSYAVRTRIARALGLKIDETETTEISNAIFLEPRTANIHKIMLELPPEHQCLLSAYIKLTFPQDDLRKVTYLSSSQPLSGEKLGNKIRAERESRNWRQGVLADKSSVSQGYLSQLENGDVESPSGAVLNRIAKSLEVDVKDLTEMTEMEVPTEIASIDQFLRDEDVPQKVKAAKLQNLLNFLSVIRDPVFQENFVITPRNQQDHLR